MAELDEQNETGCCPRFNPEPWDEKEVTFTDRLFLKDRVKSFLHYPLNFGKIMVKNMEMIKTAEALEKDFLMLSDEKSLWSSDIYISVTKDVPGADMTRISGNFLCKVFEGPYKNIGQWIKQMKAFIESKGKQTEKMYFYYTTCPKCAKVYGKNYVVILAQI